MLRPGLYASCVLFTGHPPTSYFSSYDPYHQMTYKSHHHYHDHHLNQNYSSPDYRNYKHMEKAPLILSTDQESIAGWFITRRIENRLCL